MGGALLAFLARLGLASQWTRIWLITTNDDTDALRWYQRQGFVLVALHPDAATEARRELKPEIPLLGNDGIPIRDEIEHELPRSSWAAVAAR